MTLTTTKQSRVHQRSRTLKSVDQIMKEIMNLAEEVEWGPVEKVEFHQSRSGLLLSLFLGGPVAQTRKGRILPETFGVPLVESDIPKTAYPLVRYLEKLTTSMLQRQYNCFFLRLDAPMKIVFRNRDSASEWCRVIMERNDPQFATYRGIHGLLVRELIHRKVPAKHFGRTRL